MSHRTRIVLVRLWQIAVLVLAGVCFAALQRTAPTPVAPAQPTLSQLGSRSAEVSQIQRRLSALGYYSGAVDGIFGSGTQRAVRQFQADHGLSVDGIAGVQTLQALGLSAGAAASSRDGDEALLARVISAEARGESYTGQVAVGAVIMNRVAHPSFPDSVAGVVYQPGAFTCMTDGQINEPIADSARRAAADALNGADPTGGAIYYYNPAKTSNAWMWSLPVVAEIGAHRFCSAKE